MQQYDDNDYKMKTLDPPVKVKGGSLEVSMIEFVPQSDLSVMDLASLLDRCPPDKNGHYNTLRLGMETLRATGRIVTSEGEKLPIPKNFWISLKSEAFYKMFEEEEMVKDDPNF